MTRPVMTDPHLSTACVVLTAPGRLCRSSRLNSHLRRRIIVLEVKPDNECILGVEVVNDRPLNPIRDLRRRRHFTELLVCVGAPPTLVSHSGTVSNV